MGAFTNPRLDNSTAGQSSAWPTVALVNRTIGQPEPWLPGASATKCSSSPTLATTCRLGHRLQLCSYLGYPEPRPPAVPLPVALANHSLGHQL